MTTTAPKTLVLADDHGIVREGISAFCRARPDLEIVGECGDGQAAVEMILDLVPQFAVLDLNMPKMGGLEVIQRIRQTSCPTKLIVLSICRDQNIVRELFRCGADGYVLKDGPARHLFDAISYIVDGGRYVTPLLSPADDGKGPSATDKLANLSKREHEVFVYLAEGRRPRDIARLLDISPKTVDTYRSSILRKLSVDGIAGLVRFAVERNPH